MKNLCLRAMLIVALCAPVILLTGCLFVRAPAPKPMDTPYVFMGDDPVEAETSTILRAGNSSVIGVDSFFEIEIGGQIVPFEKDNIVYGWPAFDLSTLDFLKADYYELRVRSVPRSHTRQYLTSAWSETLVYNRVIYTPYVAVANISWPYMGTSFSATPEIGGNFHPNTNILNVKIHFLNDTEQLGNPNDQIFNMEIWWDGGTWRLDVFNPRWRLGGFEIDEIRMTILDERTHLTDTGNREYRTKTVSIKMT